MSNDRSKLGSGYLAIYQKSVAMSNERVHRPLLLLAVAGLLAAVAQPADAQVDIIDYEIDEGTFHGTIHIHGGFSFPLQDAGEVNFTSNINGTATVIATADGVSGTWNYAGTGFGSGEAGGAEFTADSTYVGSGTFTGTTIAARLVGVNGVSSTGTFLGTSRTSSEEQALDEALTGVLAGCGQLLGSFSLGANQEIESQLPDGEAFFDGALVLYSDPPTDEAMDLAQRANELRNSDASPVDRISQAVALLTEVEVVQAALSAASSCPSTKQYFNLLTNIAADLVGGALADLAALRSEDPTRAAKLTASALPLVLRLGVSTGAMGAGAVDGRGADLMNEAKETAQLAVDELAQSSEHFDGLIRLAVLSRQMGWDLRFGKVSAQDVLNIFGVDE